MIDTEEEFDWAKPLARENVCVRNIAEQPRAQALFRARGVVPTYVTDHPVVATPDSASVLRSFATTGEAVIGAHLHPWVTPPDDEAVTPVNSYAGNLPAALERAKLQTLTTAIVQATGVQPQVYKAGRYGFGPHTAGLLRELGYTVDSSMVAHTAFTADGGPDYTDLPADPAWLNTGAGILELPLTAGFAGVARATGPRSFPRLSAPWAKRLRVPGVLARTRMLERVRLSPEGTTLSEMKRLTRALLADGQRVFCLAYHSSTLLPGGSPYADTSEAVASFLVRLEGYLDFFLEEIGGQPATPLDIRARLLAADKTR
ncbi:hypothetical protein CKO21_01970 [Rhodovibrio salinarum]|uniref:WalW protein n=1 Tax=Rhodovibrio salinarum TaxID=1087 RepID=A0A934UZ27_9PROT|nr:hypothetical protein [Rhodovibrio salinarum]